MAGRISAPDHDRFGPEMCIRDRVCFLDEYLCGGYGTYEEEIERTIEHVMEQYGIPLDPTYTGKAFTGMMKWLETHGNAVSYTHLDVYKRQPLRCKDCKRCVCRTVYGRSEDFSPVIET